MDLGAIQALVVAIYEIGAFLGSIFILFYGDRMGRRKAIFCGGLIMIVGALIQTTAVDSLGQLIVGRIVAGAGNGMNTSTVPVWQAECAPPKRRGFLVLFEGALIAAGITIAYCMSFCL
jgi:MFS family permease